MKLGREDTYLPYGISAMIVAVRGSIVQHDISRGTLASLHSAERKAPDKDVAR